MMMSWLRLGVCSFAVALLLVGPGLPAAAEIGTAQLEPPEVIFSNGFESGAACTWTSVYPPSMIPGGCVIEAVCYPPGATVDACQACLPELSQTEGTPVNEGGSCDDGVPCTIGDVCSQGLCAGTLNPCEDFIDCTNDSCEPATGVCEHDPLDELCGFGETCSPTEGCVSTCSTRLCGSQLYACGDCTDNDDDGLLDSDDPACLGPCDDTEDSFHDGLPGIAPPCLWDCLFDGNFGSGDDGCYWDHRCDPFELPPDYAPEGETCAYDPSVIVGPGLSCASVQDSQSQTCLDTCGPLTPNGCDSFGCCELQAGSGLTVWIRSESGDGLPSCDELAVDDPSLCRPCTPVPAAWNPCDACELCVGRTVLPPECGGEQSCPAGASRCGLPGQDPCAEGYYCITGCCQPIPAP